MKKFLYPILVIFLISLSSCLSNSTEEKLKKENDSLKMQLKQSENEIIRLRDSVNEHQAGYPIDVNYDDPQDVAKAFIKALGEENFGAAKELGTKNTAKVFGIIESIASLADDDDEMDIDNPEDITWGETIIKGNKAVCHYSTPDEPNQSIDLLLVNGQWKVDIKKEN